MLLIQNGLASSVDSDLFHVQRQVSNERAPLTLWIEFSFGDSDAEDVFVLFSIFLWILLSLNTPYAWLRGLATNSVLTNFSIQRCQWAKPRPTASGYSLVRLTAKNTHRQSHQPSYSAPFLPLSGHDCSDSSSSIKWWSSSNQGQEWRMQEMEKSNEPGILGRGKDWVSSEA